MWQLIAKGPGYPPECQAGLDMMAVMLFVGLAFGAFAGYIIGQLRGRP